MHFISVTGVLAIGLMVAACGQGADKSTSSRSGENDFTPAAASPIHGAIFTTLPDGSAVNANIYTNKEDVYLNGGPRKEGAAGLPDGEYYFTVVSPGCKEQLAGPFMADPYDTAEKIITVENGEFTDLMPLYPYMDTPNKGGEYQVRITPVDKWEDSDKGCFGFLPQYSKMDNFKVRPKNEEQDLFCISGYKWYDVDLNGEVGSPEVPVGPVIGGDGGPVAGIQISLTYALGGTSETTTTSSQGLWSFCGLPPGDYFVYEQLPNNWEPTFPEFGEYAVTITDEDVSGLGFGNVCYIDDELSPEPCELPAEEPL